MAANASLDPAAQDALPTHLPFWRMVRFTPCEHGPGDLVRLRRPQWMRVLVPNKRLYQCPHCGVRVLYAR
jgi:hypothetical protein